MLTVDQAAHFADEWIAAWNAHDLARVLRHYAEDFAMSSPRIIDFVGDPTGVLQGKPAVARYWEKALGAIPDLRFELLGIFVGSQGLSLHYRNQAGRTVVEVFTLRADGLVQSAAAYYA